MLLTHDEPDSVARGAEPEGVRHFVKQLPIFIRESQVEASVFCHHGASGFIVRTDNASSSAVRTRDAYLVEIVPKENASAMIDRISREQPC
jgi:hypothetical protein